MLNEVTPSLVSCLSSSLLCCVRVIVCSSSCIFSSVLWYTVWDAHSSDIYQDYVREMVRLEQGEKKLLEHVAQDFTLLYYICRNVSVCVFVKCNVNHHHHEWGKKNEEDKIVLQTQSIAIRRCYATILQPTSTYNKYACLCAVFCLGFMFIVRLRCMYP